MKIVLLGPPGTGKGTQAELLSKNLNLKHIVAGDIFREAVKNETELGIKARDLYWGKGKLVPDDITINLIKEKIKNLDDYLLDGFPRTLKQAKELDKLVEVDYVIYINSSNDNIIKRLLKRGRVDDSLEIIKERLKEYNKKTKPLLRYYKDKLIEINGDQKINEVFNDVLLKLNVK